MTSIVLRTITTKNRKYHVDRMPRKTITDVRRRCHPEVAEVAVATAAPWFQQPCYMPRDAVSSTLSYNIALPLRGRDI